MNKRSLQMVKLSLKGETFESRKSLPKIQILENIIIKKADTDSLQTSSANLAPAPPTTTHMSYDQPCLEDVVIEFIDLKNHTTPDDTGTIELETDPTVIISNDTNKIDIECSSQNNVQVEINEEIVANELNTTTYHHLPEYQPTISNSFLNTVQAMNWTIVEAPDYLISDDSLDKKIVAYSDSSDASADEEKRIKRKKRIHVKTSTWKQEINKDKRQFGYPYKGKKKQEHTWKYDVEKQGRVLKARCNCRVSKKKSKLDCNRIAETDREDIFRTFWALNWDQKKVYVNNTVKLLKVHRPRDRNNALSSRRTFSYEYFLRVKEATVRVCKQMYNNTLGIGEWTVLNWKKEGLPRNVKETVTTTPVAITAYAEEKEGLERFLKSLPLMESHYCRKSSTKLYIQPDWPSKQAIYKFYKEVWCSENHVKPMSSCSLYNALDKKNISIFKPKKDECELCTSYKSGNIQQSDYEHHISKKEEARNEKTKDKESEKYVFAMDLQAVLLCPKSNVSSLYYKMKLKVHNFCMYNLHTKDAYCFLWNETEGGVNAEEFASIVTKTLNTEVCPFMQDDNRRIVIYSDGCTSQNRNSVMANALLNVAMINNVVIEQKYLEKGHTQMEVDSVHACIERKLKTKVINAPAEYLSVCKEARTNPNPYRVQYLTHEYFNSYSDILFYKSIRPGRKPGDPVVTDVKAFKYMPDGQIFYKLKFSDPWASLPQRKNRIVVPKQLSALPKLYKERLKIKKRKYDDLQSLKSSLPKDYHQYYDSIPYED